jgi:hypothetical protein
MKIVIFLFFSLSMYSMKNCTEVKSVEDLLKLMKEIDNFGMFDHAYQLPTNSARIYNLSSGQRILLPGSNEKYGLLFENEECFQYYLKKDRFPIENPRKSFLDRKMELLIQLPFNLKDIQQKVNDITALNYSYLNRDVLNEYYLRLANGNALSEENYVYLCALVSEVLRVEKKGNWAFIKEYDVYNPYYEPVIIIEGGFVCQVFNDMGIYLEEAAANLDFFFKSDPPYRKLEQYRSRICYPGSFGESGN